MEAASFNRLIANTFVALTSGDRRAGEAAERLRGLGYAVFALELKLVADNAAVVPDGAAVSRAQRHTLLAEWTAAQAPDDHKRQQLGRLRGVSREELAASGIHRDAADSHSVWLLVQDEVAEEWRGQGIPGEVALTSCALLPGMGLCLTLVSGSLADPAASTVVEQGIALRRLPTWLVLLTPDDLGGDHFELLVLQDLVSRLQRGEREFPPDAVAASAVGRAWRWWDGRLHALAARRAGDVLRRLARQTKYLQLGPDGRQPWRWCGPASPGVAQLGALQRALTGAAEHPTLPFASDDEGDDMSDGTPDDWDLSV